jgi:hypothetical protein
MYKNMPLRSRCGSEWIIQIFLLKITGKKPQKTLYLRPERDAFNTQ